MLAAVCREYCVSSLFIGNTQVYRVAPLPPGRTRIADEGRTRHAIPPARHGSAQMTRALPPPYGDDGNERLNSGEVVGDSREHDRAGIETASTNAKISRTPNASCDFESLIDGHISANHPIMPTRAANVPHHANADRSSKDFKQIWCQT